MPGLITISDLNSALAALDTIVIQGEGSPSQADDSHLAQFRSIKQEYLSLLATHQLQPARPAAKNPVMRRPVDIASTSTSTIRTPPRCSTSRMRCTTICSGCWAKRGAEADPAREPKRRLIEAAMRLMHVLAAISEYLTTLPASPDVPGANAGMSFAMLRATELLSENHSEWALTAQRDQAPRACAPYAAASIHCTME